MAGFGIGWSLWGAGALSGRASSVVQILGLVLGALLITAAIRLLPRAAGGTSMIATRAYWTLVVAEFLAIGVGAAILGRSDRSEYIAAWIAAVVGVHFLAFGRLFWPGFFAIGAILLVGAATAVGFGIAGAGREVVIPVAALVAAADLFGSAAFAIGATRRLRAG